MAADLSVLIPARNEIFLQNTLDDVLAHSVMDTEVIVVLDGYWPEQGIPQHPQVMVVHHEDSIGQRAATNEAARLARAPYIMKLDAHCAVAQGFDKVLLETAAEAEPGWMQVPAQYNLHAFDWVCPEGHRRYQGPSGPCEECGADTTRDVCWKRRESRKTTAWRFDSDLHFQYWGAFKHREEGKPDAMGLSDTMSLLGACWFLSLDRFWEIGGLDEAHGSWGQMGTELACKQWLSGSRVATNHKTWFAHMFRTQGGDFGFPYPLKHHHTEAARRYSQDLWRNGKWPKAVYPLMWLVERFAPVPGWESADAVEHAGDTARDVASVSAGGGVRDGSGTLAVDVVIKGIVYYTDCRGDETILGAARKQLRAAVNGHQIVSSSLDALDFGDVRIWFANLERGYLTMFRQILAGLELCEADVVFLCEHDVLYPSEHFQFVPPDRGTVYYNENVWKVDSSSGRALHYKVRQTSGLCAYRDVLLKHYQRRVDLVQANGFSRRMGFEPGTHNRAERVDDLCSEAWESSRPLVDIRHGLNLTPSRWSKDQFRNQRYCQGWTEADEVPGWGVTKGRFTEFLGEIENGAEQ